MARLDAAEARRLHGFSRWRQTGKAAPRRGDIRRGPGRTNGYFFGIKILINIRWLTIAAAWTRSGCPGWDRGTSVNSRAARAGVRIIGLFAKIFMCQTQAARAMRVTTESFSRRHTRERCSACPATECHPVTSERRVPVSYRVEKALIRLCIRYTSPRCATCAYSIGHARIREISGLFQAQCRSRAACLR